MNILLLGNVTSTRLRILFGDLEMLMIRDEESDMTIQAVFTKMKADRNEQSAHDLLLKMTRLMEGETGLSFKQSFDRVCLLEPELHREYLNSNGEI